jgi:type III secretory pathway lipoprotein EscJ
MPEFDSYVDVDVDEFISACSKREIKELIVALIDEGHISPSASEDTDKNIGVLESQFIEKMDGLKEKYYRLSREDEKTLEDLFKKYL